MRPRSLVCMVRLYPRAWQARYGDEFAALLETCRPSVSAALDVLIGAVDAHLRAIFGQERTQAMLRLRSFVLVVFCAWVAFVLAGLAFYGTLDDNPLVELARTNVELHLWVWLVQAGAILGMLTVVVSALPVALATLRYALASKRRDILCLLAVPPISALLVGVYVAGLVLIAHQSVVPPWPDARAVILTVGLSVLIKAAAVGSAVAVVMALARSEIDANLYRGLRVPAAVVVATMGLSCAAVVGWGLSAWAIVPQVFWTAPGIWWVPTWQVWLGIVLVMTAATATGATSASRALRTRLG